MLPIAAIIVIAFSPWCQVDATNFFNKPDPMQIIKSRGFIGEKYTVNSHNYSIGLYRIINPFADPRTLNKFPVLYGHGILLDSSSMISVSNNSKPRKPVTGQPNILYELQPDGSDDNNFPFMLSNNNFDVWLFEERGVNSNSRNLSDLVNPIEANKFWDFSLDEQGTEDLPIIIDYVLAQTNSPKLVYVSYSESTWFFFALMSTYPQYQDKVVAAVLMAPVAYVAHIKGLTLPTLLPAVLLTPDSVNYDVLPQPVIDAIDLGLRSLCTNRALGETICNAVVHSFAGKGRSASTPSFFKDFYKSTSMKSIKHFLQLYVAKRFGKYDNGPAKNMKLYGVPFPPSYDLGKIKSDRLIIIRGTGDFLSTPEDQERLIKELGNRPYADFVLEKYNHYDFIDGKNLTKEVNAPAILAIYELMYREGPNILKEANQLTQTISQPESRVAYPGPPASVSGSIQRPAPMQSLGSPQAVAQTTSQAQFQAQYVNPTPAESPNAYPNPITNQSPVFTPNTGRNVASAPPL